MSSTSMSALSASPIRRHKRNTLRVCSQSWLPLAAANILSARILIFSTEDGLFAVLGALFGTERGSFAMICSPYMSAGKSLARRISINPEELLSSLKKRTTIPVPVRRLQPFKIDPWRRVLMILIFTPQLTTNEIYQIFILTFINYYK